MTCDCAGGTTYYDHDKQRWRTNDHTCRRPEPHWVRPTDTVKVDTVDT